ncbi:MAG: YggS family pyridoxal phosphate enzyme [Omnitrophica WOR_2 bacterium RIFCSPHIGHO2_02_FULL_50_17]|nr:MAG: YggS family pyridoxal phosphate enzyme [Omnitrophica WOR_2 bacterium RIFCSPHIGHO2_02_FULL_50_17]
MAMIRENFSRVSGHIASVCQRLGRDPVEIILVGATKYAEAPQIKEALEAGLKHIGENRVQEAQKKFAALDGFHVRAVRHMIGHLQTNKVRQAIELFDLIQSVDSIKLAEEIEKQAAKLNKDITILVEVNTSGEEQKFGAKPDEVPALIQNISRCPHIRLHGLMTMAPLTEDKGMIRQCFRDLRELSDAVEENFAGHERIEMKYLSMGMTSDYEIALEEGADMLRIGRAIFNEK